MGSRVFNPHSALHTPHSKGFTLLEVLIATAIMAGIVTVIYTAFFTTSRHVEQAEEARGASDLVRTLVSKLSDDLANAYVNPGISSRDNGRMTLFYGKKVQPETTDDTLRYDELYLTTLTNWRRPGTKETDLWEVGYYFKQKPDGSGYTLMRREKRELSKDVPVLEGGVEYAMTDGVKSFRCRYYNGSSWLDEWSAKDTLPKLAELTLVLEDGSAYITKVGVGR